MNREPLRRTPELLAPAGSIESLHAAVRAGADAVYLGVESFNARRGADNFTLDALAEACDYAHLRGVSVYLALNTAVLPDEAMEAMELARQAYRAGVDAFIVQDIGIASELGRTLPEARVHASTQMNTHSVAGVEAVHALGAARVTFARELSLEEVARLTARATELGMETETFVHGALCVCYSGQCFMSSMIGGRSANRGLCAQACRLPYTLHNKALRKTLDAPGEHLLSPKDLCAIELLPALVDAGVTSFKIEGRMKSPDYVYAVVSVYRCALDDVLAAHADRTSSERHRVPEEDARTLAEAFSRGFTTAYLEQDRGNDIMSYGRPNNRGVFVGRVTDVRSGAVEIAADERIVEGDVLEFWTNKGHFAHTVDRLERDRSGAVVLPVAKKVGKGDRVFRVRSAQAAYADDPLEPRIVVKGRVSLRVGEPLCMRFETASGTSIELEGPLIEPARTKPVTADEVREHIDRLGNLPFSLAALDVEVGENAGIGFSQLHKLRTRALTKLAEAMLEPYRSRRLPRIEVCAPLAARATNRCDVAALATNPACARAAKRAGANLIYVPALNYKRGEAVIAGQLSGTAEQAGYPKQAIIALPTVEHDGEGRSREEAVGFDAWAYVKAGKPVLVENLGQLARALALGALPEVGPHLPVLNRLALEVAVRLGAERVWLSPELSLRQIEALGKETPVSLGLTIMGSQELMVTEHCLLMSQGPCSESCASCARRKSPHYLKDRKGYEFPVVTDCCGRSHLYNAVSLDVAHALPDLIDAGVSAVMVDTSLMNVEETTKAVQRAVRARDIALSGGNSVSKAAEATSGHLFRGVK
ncbi:DUF3656 domain-containing U32 family peptidase [Raoultibacter phocaeensis]|uniref:DUF3656 domain-containing U32 family peptidase n=1 Tax=Raoultibacter phocaeensis TaxID=2479841 RepID=UPI00111B28FF|nr:U32 family peptidase [Raoultibacter phocaeensis]